MAAISIMLWAVVLTLLVHTLIGMYVMRSSGGGRNVMSVNRFVAAYDGACAECGELIEEGDDAGFIDDDMCCGVCVTATERERDAQPSRRWAGSFGRRE